MVKRPVRSISKDSRVLVCTAKETQPGEGEGPGVGATFGEDNAMVESSASLGAGNATASATPDEPQRSSGGGSCKGQRGTTANAGIR